VTPATKPRARLIIPVWGEKYVERLDIACLPAVLAPGNMPHLAEHFDCELAIVTQAALFDKVRALPSVQALQQYCALVLIAMDDVLSHPSFYGYTITQSLYRGFTQLGAAATDTWCLFLNADFVLADGSYRALVERMLAGERLIMAPSYCAIEEDVRPVMEARIRAAEAPRLTLQPREMADLILRHRHFSIRAKIINWQMYRIDRVDQFYYQVDNDTMLAKQLPIAIVAFRPERVPTEPVAFWDYGVVSEVCPTSRLCVLGDSDEFLMLELRGRTTMSEQFQLGWLDPDSIARDLSIWTTKDQRDCGAFTMVVHRHDLPPTTEAGRTTLEAYYQDILRRATPHPRDHRDHYIWTGMLQLHADWQRSRVTAAAQAAGSDAAALPASVSTPPVASVPRIAWNLLASALAALVTRGGAGVVRRHVYDLTRTVYRRLFGRVPEVGHLHPLAGDLHDVVVELRRIARPDGRALSLWSVPHVTIAPHLSRWFAHVVTASPTDIARPDTLASLAGGGPFSVCFLELSRDELLDFAETHARLRGLMRKGAKFIVFYRTRGVDHVAARDFQLIANAMPECDLAVIRFTGSKLSYWLQRTWDVKLAHVESGQFLRAVRFGLWVALVAIPVTVLARRTQRRRDPRNLPAGCTSLCLEVTVL